MKLGFILADNGTRNNRHWSAHNSLLLYEVPLHDDHVGAWCAVSAARIIKPVFVRTTRLHQCYALLTLG
jgi:hypothetical protein